MTPFNPSRSGDRYLALLGFVLVGYALMGKGFAYFGYPPLFVGEIAFLTGVAIFLQAGCFFAVLTTGPALLLATLMMWVIIRTVPYLSAYGFQAARDSVVILYGGFAFIVMALMLQDDRRVEAMLRSYRTFLGYFVPAILVIYPCAQYFADYIPFVPGTDIRLVWVDAGQVAVHLTGAALFALVGLRSATLLWTGSLLATLLMASAASRGGMMAFVVPVTLATVVLGKTRQLVLVIIAGLAIFSATYALEASFGDYHEPRATRERTVSARQMLDNVVSVFSQADQQTEGTKTWRLEWWGLIIKDTFFGPYFWNGRGFGLNLGDADGFRDGSNPQLPPLRSPHSVHMTILSRAGVPGFVLWVSFLASWFGMMMRAMWSARRLGQTGWAGLFLFVWGYGMSFVINGSFDVALEGPMQGIWFWCLIGFGIGSVMSYRYRQTAQAVSRSTVPNFSTAATGIQ